MKYERSIKAVDAAIAFGEGKISREELDDAANAANARWSADWVANAAWSAANVAHAAEAATYAWFAAREENQQLTADICRKYLPIEIWNIEP